MIYSQWQPDGGYLYYEASSRHPIGDDVPAQLPAEIGNIGVPVQDVGVPLPQDAKVVGRGEEPVGVLTPMFRGSMRTLGEATQTQDKTAMVVVALFVAGVLVVGGLFREDR